MKKFSLGLTLLLCICSFSCQKEKKEKPAASFEDMMGRQLDCWQHVIAPVDFGNLIFFKELFEKNSSTQFSINHNSSIPKVLHFIWLGPKEFPRDSIPNIQSWVEKHPGWKVKFWTDRKRNLPSTAVDECLVQNWNNLELEKCYAKTNNFAEKADLLRYDILFKEGGVYVDHDVKCFKSFDELNNQYDLYCGLELPSDTPISSSIHVTNNLIAAKAGHPVLARCIEWLPKHWDEIESLYPGSDKSSVIRRIANRTFVAFGDSVRELAGKTTHDMVFPAYYFNAPTDEQAVYARHLYAGSWYQNENPFEKMARGRLMLLSKKVNKILLFTGIATALNLIGMGFLFFSIRKNRKVTG